MARTAPANAHLNIKKKGGCICAESWSRKSGIPEVEWTATNRDRCPYDLTVPPHSDRLNHAPFPQPIIPQRDPQEREQSQAVNVNEREGDLRG